MPGLLQDQEQRQSATATTSGNGSGSSQWKFLDIKELHPTFAAEASGVDLAHASEEEFQEILAAMAKYGVLVFRDTGLSDAEHVEFSKRFGELDGKDRSPHSPVQTPEAANNGKDIRPYIQGGRKPRYDFYELFDAGNVDNDGNILQPDSARTHYGKGNGFFHVDSSFNPRRASYSLLKASVLPPAGTGGNTEFADTRSAFETLPFQIKERLLNEELVGVHSLHHSRKRGSPEYFKDLNPEDYHMHRHRIAQRHEASGRVNLYVGAHMARIEPLAEEDGWALMWSLMGWATRPENTVSVEWRGVGDLVIWYVASNWMRCDFRCGAVGRLIDVL